MPAAPACSCCLPLDWALIEAWKNGGVPLEAVLRGIDAAFEKWRKKPARARIQMVNSIAYCTQAISQEAQAMANNAPVAKKDAPPPFSLEDVRAFLSRNAAALRKGGQEDLAASLEALDAEALFNDLEQLEQRLTAIEEKLIARLKSAGYRRRIVRSPPVARSAVEAIPRQDDRGTTVDAGKTVSGTPPAGFRRACPA